MMDLMRNIALVSPFEISKTGGVTGVIRNLLDYYKLKTGMMPLLIQQSGAGTTFSGNELSFAFPSVYWDDEVHFKEIPGVVFYSKAIFQRLKEILQAQHIQLLHLHYFADYFFYFYLLSKTLKFKYVITLHGSDVRFDLAKSRILRSVARPIFNSAEQIILVSEALKNDFLSLFPKYENKTQVIRNGACLSKDNSKNEEPAQKYILCSGNLYPVKGHDILIRAFKIFQQQFPDYHLYLAGDGPCLQELEQLAFQLQIKEKVHFLGNQSADQIGRLLSQCQFYVQPSRNEGYPLAVIEAMLAQKPIIATAVGGLPEMIEHDVNGFLVEPARPKALAQTMSWLAKNKSYGMMVAGNARELAQKKYTVANSGEKYIHEYEKILSVN